MKTFKPSEMSPEVRAMIELRHQAEQRGHFSPLGRLLSMETQHGTIVWPSERGEGVGPDLALVSPVDFQTVEGWRKEEPSKDEEGNVCPVGFKREMMQVPRIDSLIVLGAWVGLPALRHNSTVPCAKCRHACDICDGSGKKVCEGLNCGGRGTVPGVFALCTAPNCSRETGKPKPECEKCGGSGQVAEMITCSLCCGSGKMTCSRCRGTGKFSTGRVNGSIDWQLPKCKACDGTGWKGSFVKQDVAKFTQAEVFQLVNKISPRSKPVPRSYFALGPVYSFAVQDFQTSKPRSFDVSPDEKGELLFMLVPASPRQKPQKAYLVGGVVRERSAAQGAA